MVNNNCKSYTWVPRNFIYTIDWLNIVQPVENTTNLGKKHLNYYGKSDHSKTFITTETKILASFYTVKVIKIYRGVNLVT